MGMKKVKFLLISILFFAQMSLAALRPITIDTSYDEFEEHELVEVLLKDRKYLEAEIALGLLEKNERENARYFRFLGQIEVFKNKKKEALIAFQKAFEKIKSKTNFDVQNWDDERFRLAEVMAPLSYEQGHFQECLLVLTGVEIINSTNLQILKSQCAQKIKDWKIAYESLLSDDDYFVLYQKLSILLDLNLEHEAERFVLKEISRQKITSQEALSLIDLILQKGDPTSVSRCMEALHLLYPTSPEVTIYWAKLALQRQQVLFVAEAFKRLSSERPQYYYQTAEFFRQAQKPYWSRFYQGMIPDLKEKLKAQVALAIDLKKYSEIVTLEKLLQKYETLKDDDMKYALAYALYDQGDFDKSLHWIAKIQDLKMKQKTDQLKEKGTVTLIRKRFKVRIGAQKTFKSVNKWV